MLAPDHALLPGTATAPPAAMLEHWRARCGAHTGPLDFWATLGLGSRAQGLLTVPDPEWLAPILNEWLGGPSDSRIPLAYTGLGDILYFRDLSQRARDLGLDEETIRTACDVSLLNTRYKQLDVLAHSMGEFLAGLEDPEFIDEVFERPLFESGIAHAGLAASGGLPSGQILGYVPALALGGGEGPENLQALSAPEHWSILFQC